MGKWHHLAYLAICAAVAGLLATSPEQEIPPMPADPEHRDRQHTQRCPACHGPEAIPDKHLDASGRLRRDHARCYFCHSAGGWSCTAKP